jgi:hypothetical protein
MPRVASEKEIITVVPKVYTTAGDGTLRCDTQADGSAVLNFERHGFRGAGRRLTAMEQLPAGSVLEPARPETAGDTPRDLTSRLIAFQPDEKPWYFDGCELTSARNRIHRSPMLSHETSPVLGASVMGMTIWVGQGQSHLPADITGITATSGQGGRLRPRSQLRQQPADVFPTGGPSRRRRRKPSTDALLKAAGSQQDRQRLETGVTPATHGLHQPHQASPSSTKGSKANQGFIPRICRSKGKRCFIKRHTPRQRAEGSGTYAKTAAMGKPAAGLPNNIL